MNDIKTSGLLTMIKRVVVIVLFIATILLITYACNSINTVSTYNLNLKNCIGWVYQTEDQKMMLVINDINEAYLNAGDESGVYSINQKDNVLFLEKGEEEKKEKTVFIPTKENELFWQSKNILFYHYQEDEE